MNPISFAIQKPVTIVVGVLIVALCGVIALLRLPVQLTPNVDKPIVTVSTFWEGASPQEIEREILEEQEERLKSIQGLVHMNSSAVEGSANIELEFRVGSDISRALLDVSEKLRQVPGYPENVDEPIVFSGEGQAANAIAWFILRRTEDSKIEPERIIESQTFLLDEIKPRLERTPGIAQVGVIGGVDREVHVDIDPYRLAARQLSLAEVRDAIRRRNVDVSAGDVEKGKRASKVRTVGKFDKIEELADLLLARRDGQTVFLRDVADVRFGFKEATRVVRSRGAPAIAVNATRQSGTNVIQVMSDLQASIANVNRELLEPRGLRLVQVYDQTDYIFSAIDLVTTNLWVGGSLAVLMLLLFLRQWRSTLIVGLAIPVSTVGAFVGLIALGRNLNVISLAGLAFAVGMVVDNSIVVLENIYRHRQLGASRSEAALRGTQEVWGAVLASTLTTLAVFVPVLFVQEEAGQLFRDIAIAISAAVAMSLLVSVLFIPMVASRIVGVSATKGWRAHLFGLVALGERFTAAITSLVVWINASLWRGLTLVGGITVVAFAAIWLLTPRLAYLPDGNQNLVFGFMISPPGYSRAEFVRIGEQIESKLAPYWSVSKSEELSPELQRPDWYQGKKTIPAIDNFFFVALESTAFLGARSVDDDNVRPLADLLTHAAAEIPGVMLFASQRSLFERGINAGNTIDLEISGYDLDEIKGAAGALFGTIIPKLGVPRPEPANFNLGGPELRITIDEARAAELGLGVRELGFAVRTMVDGAKVSEFRDRGATLDVKLRPVFGDRYSERLGEIPLWTPAGRQVQLASVAKLEQTSSPTEIRHIEEQRAIRLKVTPPENMNLTAAMEMLRDEVIAPLRADGVIPPSVETRLAGTASKLSTTRDALSLNLLLAVIITYLLLSALFESFVYPLVIMLTVPFAGVGGILGLRAVSSFTGQQLDVLTMLGFVILVGTVVNNAILIVHRTLQGLRSEGLAIADALADAVSTRVRPIFMSTLTSVLGMTPLVLFPGAGSELYRGLGSVVVGGLLASTVFTLLLVPALFRILWSVQLWIGVRLSRFATA